MFIKIPFKNKKIEFWEIKNNAKLLIKKIFFKNDISRKIISYLIYFYLFFVYKTCRKKFIGFESHANFIEKNSIIFSFWHNRLMMIPFLSRKIKKKIKNFSLMTLASRHGDGRIVGEVMERFGLISVLGSSKDKRGSHKGIEYSNLKKIINGLKSGCSLGITPDGPRGPNQEINGEIINIAKLTGASLINVSYSCSRFIIIKKSWDKFKIPLPFSRLCFVVSDNIYKVDKNMSESDLENLKLQIRDDLNHTQNLADSSL
ncbi:MAG: lysophospholipid acyltransferase family protein [Rickettsiales bacterium]